MLTIWQAIDEPLNRKVKCLFRCNGGLFVCECGDGDCALISNHLQKAQADVGWSEERCSEVCG